MPSVDDIMTTTVRTMHRGTLVPEVKSMFVEHKISGAPLVDDLGHLVGFVSKSDIIRFDSDDGDPNCVRAYEIGTPKVISIAPSAPVEEAAQKMVLERVDHLVVMKNETMAGILSQFDFVKIVAETPGRGKIQ